MEWTEHNLDLRSNGDRKTPMRGNKVRPTAILLGELGKVLQSVRVWRTLVAERWPWTPQRRAAGMSALMMGLPSGSSAGLRLPGGLEVALRCPEDSASGGLFGISGHITGI